MPSALQLEIIDGRIGLITFDMPGSRANTLGQAILGEFETLLTTLEGRADLQGIILQSGKQGMFIAGADLNELGSASPDPATTRALVQRGLNIVARFEKLPCPTVAVIDGACMGGGTEVALGFDYRLAGTHPKMEIGLPEVKIGLIPGWGGTQRLSRLVGPNLAAELICAGEAARADRARSLGIVFDVVPSERLRQEAIALLDWSRQSRDWEKIRARKRLPVGLSEEQRSFAHAVVRVQIMAKTRGLLPAPLAAADAIFKGCNVPLDEGLKVETDAFAPLVGSPISKNLIAVFFMTQRLQKDPGVPDAAPRDVGRVGVLGAGIMGSGIAGAHVRRGVPALMLDNDTKALEKGVGAIVKVMQGRVEIGRMTQEDVLRSMGLLNTTGNLSLMSDCDVAIEAVVENEEVKTKLYRDLQSILKPDAILASNTSTISITRMARATARPENFAGMHFFNPVDRMQLVEVIRGEHTSDAVTATLVALAKRIGKTPIVVKDCPGFLVNRILFPYINESLVLLEEGADPRAIDRAATDLGMPMGPITLNDLVGLDTSLYAGRVVNQAFADRARDSRILAELVKAGRLGKKSGAGFYNYARGSRGADDPGLIPFLERCRTAKKSFTPEELTDRLFLPMLVEASRVLMEGIVRQPADVDMGLILGIGFPPQLGGLLRWADSVGPGNVLARLKKYESLGPRFAPTEQMRLLASAGKGFYQG
jgi:3-hydroxyacyl-CoA dehydrogenase/enoyl-CoA hydratase/3-hydroxybutyryl-CoA epimerase/enoyl-CoA isomerase